MAKGSSSGHSLGQADIPVVLGMASRGDRNHDIAAWFGVNQGRIAEAKSGQYGNPPVAPHNELPPSGAPGIKGRRLRMALEGILESVRDSKISDSNVRSDVQQRLENVIAQFDQNEG